MKVADQISDSGLCSLLTGTASRFSIMMSWSLLQPLNDTQMPRLPLVLGGVFNGQWFASAWPNELLSVPVNTLSTALLELCPIVIACILWGKQWSRKQIMFFCDNEATVNIINKGRSSVPFINRLLGVLLGYPYWVTSIFGLLTFLA